MAVISQLEWYVPVKVLTVCHTVTSAALVTQSALLERKELISRVGEFQPLVRI